ncbi:MAG: 1-deoxy-D-xylulose-5-phosphate reductoisomerase [Candidatus Omnitrophica bacterium]|nr:1-deoxy-D-xylulose-5-phosphate reductoisomerase [Candidatus Omnitrophota bacterium]
MKKVVILGSTGYIGRAALDVISRQSEKFSVFGLAANTQKDLLMRQVKKFNPSFAVLSEKCDLEAENIGRTKFLYGERGLEFISTHPETDIVVMAISGLAGLSATFKALEVGKIVALASKEVVVCAGHMLSDKKGKILPIDSEHNAIFQLMEDLKKTEYTKIILTASGGPFLSFKGDLSKVTVDQVLNHPVWKMGKRITVDSATMMNKGLEIIEASYLFNIESKKIDVVLHPQAIVHGFLMLCDGFTKAIFSLPDMKYSINYCLNYPERVSVKLPELDISQVHNLTFEEIKEGRFPCLDLARQALEMGTSYLVVLNAADEEAVNLFLNGIITFDLIPQIVKMALDTHKPVKVNSIEDIFEIDRKVKQLVRKFVKKEQ